MGNKIFTRSYQVITNVLYWLFTGAILISLFSFGTSTLTTGEGTIFGNKPIIVMTGSMEPTILTKSIIVGKEITDPRTISVDDIVTFKVLNEGVEKRITHRIIAIDTEHQTVTTKGDNNSGADMYDVSIYPNGLPMENVQYKITHVFNWVAYLFVIFSDPIAIGIAIVGLVGFVFIVKMVKKKFYNPEYEIKLFKNKNNKKPE